MVRRLELTGQRFGRWVVLGYAHSSKTGQALWSCRCDCGTLKDVRGNDLVQGKSLSCKCLNYEVSTTHGMSGTKLYQVWANMKDRCYNLKAPEYKNYGARGVTVDDSWLQSFELFRHDMEPTYREGLTLDREDVNGNYNRSNCRWADNTTQQNNRRNTVYCTIDGVTDSFGNMCRKYNVEYEVARGRKKLGWDMERIFKTPKSKRRKVGS